MHGISGFALSCFSKLFSVSCLITSGKCGKVRSYKSSILLLAIRTLIIGGKVKMLLQDLHGVILDDPTSKAESLTASAKYFVRNLHSNSGYAAKFVFCEFLNLANILSQLFLMHAFLGSQFLNYGIEAIKASNEPFDQRVDVLSKIFPKVI